MHKHHENAVANEAFHKADRVGAAATLEPSCNAKAYEKEEAEEEEYPHDQHAVPEEDGEGGGGGMAEGMICARGHVSGETSRA